VRDPADHPVAPPAEGFVAGAPDVIRGGPQLIPRPEWSEPGGPAPWAATDPGRRRPSLDAVRAALSVAPSPTAHPIGPPDQLGPDGRPPPRRESAVLALLYEHDGGAVVLLTRRSWDLRSHRGEVSFPGGGREAADPDLVTTALRETEEEVGIPARSVEIIGELDHLATVSSGSTIVPYVGAVRGRPSVTPDPREVAEVLHVPLAELLAPGVYREERWRLGTFERPVWFFELEGDTVWGATAAILRRLLVLVTGA